MLRAWFHRISGSSTGPDCVLPDSEQDIEAAPEASKPSFMARLFDGKPVAVKQIGGGSRAADEREMEEGGVMSSCYGYGGNVGNTQQQAPLWQAGPGAWDAAAGIKGDATAVVNLYRGKLLGQQAAGQRPQLCLPSQTMAAMAAPPPPMAIPAWLQRRKSTLPSAAMATAAHPAAPPFQPPHAPAPCPLRPCPPNSTGPGSLRVESFTAGTGGRLMRPGVGIGAGLMREARYSDLRFIHQIGEGGFGKVYYGHWQGAPVAIKVAALHHGTSGGGGGESAAMRAQLQEFQREVTNMSTIAPHPNVLKLLGACMEAPHMVLVTEFCSRGSLYHMLHSAAPHGGGGNMQLTQQLLSIWLGTARGMQHLHASRVVHRDLKSANLLLDDFGSIKIGDFGLSRLCQTEAVQKAMTGALGTYQWMAPEVLTSQRYSEKADVYSFGMVMWECLSRKIPFEDMPALAAAMNVATLGMRPVMPPVTDPAHARLIRECWAPVPDQRPAFTTIVARLEAFVAAAAAPSPLQLAPPAAGPSASAAGPDSGNGSSSSAPSNSGVQTVLSASSSEGVSPPLGRDLGSARTTSSPEGSGAPHQPAGMPERASETSIPEGRAYQQPTAAAPPPAAPSLVTPRGVNLIMPRGVSGGSSGLAGGMLMSGDSSGGGGGRAEHRGTVPLVGPPPRQYAS